MFRSKKDVDRHVREVLRKLKNENEKNMRCFNFAKLYLQVGDYESARRYVSSFLSYRESSSIGRKLLGQALEALGQKEKALAEYKCSLELDSKQSDLVLKVCELLLDPEVTVDAGRAKYWCNRAQALHPHHPAVFRLKEHLLTAEGDTNSADLEALIASEIVSRPMDVSLRVKLLRLFLAYKPILETYQHAMSLESRGAFRSDMAWYDCLGDICQAYQAEKSYETNWEFYLQYVSVLERSAFLCLQEHEAGVGNRVVDSIQALYRLDQVLYQAGKVEPPPSEHELYDTFLGHMRAQLCLHLATLIFKKARKDGSDWRESTRVALPLLFFALGSTPDLEAPWLLQLQETRRKVVQLWALEAAFRNSQAGHVILGMVRDRRSQDQFLDRVSQFCSEKWRERVYQGLFGSREYRGFMDSSHFVNFPGLNIPRLRLPTVSELRSHDEKSQYLNNSSLHHLVWLGLQELANTPKTSAKLGPKFRCVAFDNLQFSCNNLNNCGSETLCKLDMDSFLYATVLCSGAILEEQHSSGYWNNDQPRILPACLTEMLCTPEQGKWWKGAFQVYTNQAGGDLGELRQTLKRGIEVVRVVGNHGLDAQLIVHLANIFSSRAEAMRKKTEVSVDMESVEARASLYWTSALFLLDRLQHNLVIRGPSSRLFEYTRKELSAAELTAMVEDGQLFLALQLVKEDKLDQAVESLDQLRSPYASFHQALVYRRLASNRLGDQRGEMITSEMRSQHVILLSKTRECLYLTMDRLRGSRADPSHPLNSQLKTYIEEVDHLLRRVEPDSCCNDVNRNECDGISDESVSSVPSAGGDNPNSFLLTPRHRSGQLKQSSTPLCYGHSESARTPRRTEARPSPERLEAQMRHLAHNQDTVIKTLLEQNKAVLESIKNLVLEDKETKLILEELKKDVQSLRKEWRGRRGPASQLDLGQVCDPDEDPYALDHADEYEDDLGMVGAVPQLGPYPNFPSYPAYRNMFPPPDAGNPMYPAALVYPAAGFYNQPALPFSEGQQLPDFRTAPPALFSKPEPPVAPVNVVITSSDALPTSAPAHLPKLSVTIPLQHRHAFQISMPPRTQQPQVQVLAAPSPALPLAAESLLPSVPSPMFSAVTPDTTPGRNRTTTDSENDEEPEHDPCPDFQPLIPLPAEVAVTTGEEEETVLFESRAKLFRFCDKEWKERGVGLMKLLHNEASGKVRVLMRREQVYKVCANHMVQHDMELLAMGDRAWMWFANDFADEQMRLEKLCVRFKMSDEALNFRDAFERAKAIAAGEEDSGSEVEESASSSSEDVTREEDCPVEPLPAPRTSSGGEVILFEMRAKLFRMTDGEWKECGVGVVKLLHNKETSKVQLVMWRDQVLTVCINQLVLPSMVLLPMKDRAWCWSSNNGVDEIQQKYCLRFRTPSEAESFRVAFAKARALTSEQVVTPVSVQQASPVKFSVGGFTFASTPALKPTTPAQVDTHTEPSKLSDKPSPFASFTFTSPTKPDSGEKLMFNSAPGNLSFSSIASQDNAATFKVDSDFKGFKGAGKALFVKETSSTQKGDDSTLATEEFEPTAEFRPVIPLPELVELRTGEEGEDVLFEERAKLLRFDTEGKQWKERGLGKMKVLRDPTTGKARLLMRREQVLKVCCNHGITPELQLKPFPTSDRAWSWYAQDFSEGEVRLELLAIKFKSAEQAESFKQVVESMQGSAEVWRCGSCLFPNADKAGYCRSCNQAKLAEGMQPSLSQLFKPRTGSWNCKDCYVSNESSSTKCVACNAINPNTLGAAHKLAAASQTQTSMPHKKTNIAQKPLSELLKPNLGRWTCNDCYLSNEVSSSKCVACQAVKPGASVVPPPPKGEGVAQKPLSELLKPSLGSWTCNDCYLSNEVSSSKCVACQAVKPGASVVPPPPKGVSVSQKPLSKLLKHKPGSWTCNDCYLPNEASRSKCAACQAVKPGAEIQNGGDSARTWVCTACWVKNEADKTHCAGCEAARLLSWECRACFTCNEPDANSCLCCRTARHGHQPSEAHSGPIFRLAPSTGSGFNLGPAPTTSGFSFGIPQASLESKSSTPSFLFGSGNESTQPISFTFGDTTKGNITPPRDEPLDHKFIFGSPGTFDFNFSGVRSKSPGKSPKSPKSPGMTGEEDSDSEVDTDEGEHIQFQPVIPLPDRVPILTGEEEEEVLYRHRAKLFRFVDGEWKERGVGDFKVLRNNSTGKFRLVMRRDQVLKLCLNHFLTKQLCMMEKDERSCIWSAHDYSEGQLSFDKFALRFKTKEIASDFQQFILTTQAGMEDETDATRHTVQSTTGDPNCDTDGSPSTSPQVSSSRPTPSTPELKGVAKTLFNSPVVEDDCEVVYELQVTAEEQAAAESLLLPSNFYSYRRRPGCPGCIGCEPEEVAEQEALIKISASAPAATVAEEPLRSSPVPLVFVPKIKPSMFGDASSTTPIVVQFPSKPTTTMFNLASSTTPSMIGQTSIFAIPKLGQVPSTTPLIFCKPASSVPQVLSSTVGATTLLSKQPPDGAPQVLSSTVGATTLLSKQPPDGAPQVLSSTVGATTLLSKQPPDGAPQVLSSTVGARTLLSKQPPDGAPQVLSSTVGATTLLSKQPPDGAPQVLSSTVLSKQVPDGTPQVLSSTVGTTTLLSKQPPDGAPQVLSSTVGATTLLSKQPPDGAPQVLSSTVLSKQPPDGAPQVLSSTVGATTLLSKQPPDGALQVLNSTVGTTTLLSKQPPDGAPQVLSSTVGTTTRLSKQPPDGAPQVLSSTVGTTTLLSKKPPDRASQVLSSTVGATKPVSNQPPDRAPQVLSSTVGATTLVSKQLPDKASQILSSLSIQTSKPVASQTLEAAPLVSGSTISCTTAGTQSPPQSLGTTNQPSVKAPLVSGSVLSTNAPIMSTTPQLFSSNTSSTMSLFGSSVSSSTSEVVGQSPIFFGRPTSGVFDFKQSLPAPIFGSLSAPQTKYATLVFGQNEAQPAKQPGFVFGSTPSPFLGQPFVMQNTAADPSTFSFLPKTVESNTSSFGFVQSGPPTSGPAPTVTPAFKFALGGVDSTTSSFSFSKAAGEPAEAEQEKEAAVSFLPTDTKLSFANLASSPKPAVFSPAGNQSFAWEGAGKTLFRGTEVTPDKSKGDSSGEEADAAEDQHDPQFEPIIALPDAIEVRTGEEDEERVFCHRAKLFRYEATSRQWKERGTGEMKVLHHPTNGTYRLLLRREQVHKVVLNHLVTPSLELKPMNSSDRAWCWAAINHVEDSAELEKLAVRFKLAEVAQEFHQHVQQAAEELAAKQAEEPEDLEDEDEDEPEVEEEPVVEEPEEEVEEGDEYVVEDEEEQTVMFQKRAQLLVKDMTGWMVLGQGDLLMTHDNSSYATHILVTRDDGMTICDTVIAVNASLKVEGRDCIWDGTDYSQDIPMRRTFQAKFSSEAAALEFQDCFKEGKAYADDAGIFEYVNPEESEVE